MRSPAIRIVVSGVRSSWDTSETNRCWNLDKFSIWAICCWMLAAISLNDVASVAMSSSPLAIIRSPNAPAANRWATSAAPRAGATTRRVTT